MGPVETGLILPLIDDPLTGESPSWELIRATAGRAEELGFDTVWIPDELLWKVPDWPGPRGWWECVAMTGAVAASTSTIGVGTWVLSALHRNPGLTAKIATTLDEVSGGRFLFGLGSGHAGSQGAAFGYPPDKTVGRYEEALQIITPLLKGHEVDFDGRYHRSAGLENRPQGPRPGGIPLMLGAHGPRMMRLAATYGDIWSAYATESSLPEAFGPMLQQLDQACEQIGRDPATLGRSVGVFVEPTDDRSAEEIGLGVPITGGPEGCAEAIATLAEMGFTRVEVSVWPRTLAALEAMAPMLELLAG